MKARLNCIPRVFGQVACAALLLLATLWGGPARAQATIAFSGPDPATKSGADHADRCLAAVDLAIIAAESGALDVSIEAIRRACQEGPPVASVDLGGILGSGGGSPVRSFSSRNQENPADAAQANLASRLCKLHDVWVAREVDPQQAYRAWKELVFPPSRPNDAYPYSSVPPLSRSISYGNILLDVEIPALAPSGAANVVHWARAAGQLDDLNATLDKRASLPGAADTVTLVRVIMAGYDDAPAEEGEAQCRALSERPTLLIDHPHAVLLFGHTWKLIERLGQDSPPAEQLLTTVINSMAAHERWAANNWLKYLVAWKLNDAIKRGDREAFQRAAQVATSQFNPIRAGNAEYVAGREANLYTEAARRAFESNQPELGIDCLKTMALLPDSDRYGDGSLQGVLLPQSPMMKGLVNMEPAERLEFLNIIVWRAPMLGLHRYAMQCPTDRVPSLFASSGSAAQRRSQITRDDAICYSLLEWAMRDSLAQGKEAEVEARINELKSRGSDDAKLAQLIWDLTRGERVDFDAFSQEGKEGKRRLVSPVRGDRVTLLDLELMRAAIADDKWREAGGEFLDERLSVAIPRSQYDLVASLRALRLDFRRLSGKPEMTHEALLHWTLSNHVGQGEILAGKTPDSVWTRADEETWNHECGPTNSYLIFRYPLTGDYTWELDCIDYAWREGAAAMGGLMVEYWRHKKQLLLLPMGERASHEITTDKIGKDKYTRYRYTAKQGKVELTLGENDFHTELGEYSANFPFVVLSSARNRDSSFKNLKITGEPTIPREVELLSNTLMGWSGRLKGAKLPALKISRGELVVDPEKAESEIVEWQVTGGELQSIDQVAEREKRSAELNMPAKPYEEKRREAIIQYLRPLCDGEQIDLEFYYEPGRFCLAPSLGRIALLLDEPEMGLHWVTFDNEIWTGVAPTNRVVDPNAEQLAPIELKAQAWNELQLRLEGETLVVSLNGKPVYRRQWEQQVDRKFGLFHDPTQYHVRVRNVRLSGDWPEKLPTDFWELRPGNKI
jgi:hypothetical protein